MELPPTVDQSKYYFDPQTRTWKTHQQTQQVHPQPIYTRPYVESQVQRGLGYVSVPTTVGLACLGIIIGYFIGWITQSSPHMSAIGAIVGVVIGISMRYPIKMWINWNAARPEQQIVDSIMKDIHLSQEQEQVQPAKKKKSKDEFDQEDFDEPSKAMLIKIVRQARKDGVKVTGQQFFTTVLKSIR